MLERITKRDGTTVPFEPDKIKGAITKAFISARGSDDEDLIDRLTKAVVRLLKVSLKDKPEDTIINVEEVQDAVETILIKYNLPKVAKEYILFRDCHNKIRKTKDVMINAQTLVGDYIDKLDWRVNENANSGYSYASMLNHISGSVVANYTLSNIYPERIAKAHRDGDFHIHDLSAGIIPYCMGHSLKELLMMGFVGSGGRASSKPAKHLDSALQQISNFMATLQTEAAGAQAFSSWDTYLAPFVRNDGLTYQQVKQAVQQFIFGLNIASRWGQCPFTNLTMDLVPPSDLKDMPVIIGGELQDTTYGEYQTEMDMLNKAFIETMIEGDAEGKIFTFPIPTYNIVKDFDWEGDVAKKLFELTCKFGSPYFANYLNSDMNPSDSRSMCPLTPDTKVIVASKLNGIRIVPIGVVYHGYTNKNTEYFTLTPDGWKKAVPVRMELTDVYKITLSNGVEVKMGENHLQPILTEEGIKSIRAKDLDVDTWIPFNKNGYDTDIGSFNLGYAVGAYIGDGSKNDNGIIYSLSSFEKDDITIEKLTLFWHSIGYETKITKSDRHVRFLRVNGSSYDIIKRFVKGVNALTKDITDDVFKMSFDFRAGLVSGFKATDGSEKRNRLYTSSNDLRHSMQMLFASLGKHCLVNYIDNRDSRLGKNENYRIDFPDRQNYGELFKQDDSFNYYRITRIEKVSGKEKWLYCFEVDNQSQLFYLANGMLTHNCRLRLDLKELRRKNGGLFGSGELTGCYDDQTEVLTNNGWKLFKDVLPDDEICTLSSESEIEYHKPIQSFIYDYDGELIHFKSLKSDLMVTPNHRMLYADKHNHKHGFVNAEDYSITKHPIPNKGTWCGGKYSASIFELPAIKSEWKSGNYGSNQIKKWDAIAIDMITWVKFLGLWLSEGSVDNINNATTHGYRVTISQTKEYNLKYIEEILNSMPFKWVYDGKDFIICNKQLWTYMKQFGKQKDRYVPTYVKDLGADYIAAFLDALWLGDGSVHKTSGQSVYYTTSKQLADDVQELLVKAGYQASMHQRKPRISKIGDRTVNSSMICYEVSVRFSAYTYLNDKISKRVPYRGKVYCLEVPNNTMMVRRNGYTLWCGNSVGVCTINMPRIGYLASNKEEFFSKLEYLMVLAKDSLEIKRKIAQANIDNGLLPYTKIYVKSLKNHFSTIGLVGLNEACLNLLGCDLTTPEGQDFGVETLEFMRSKMSEFQEETGNLFNLEGVPAEATAYRLAKIDKEKFGDIITAGTDEVPYYTNSSQIPVGYTDDIFEACDLQDRLQPLYTGGIVQHLYLGERIEDPAQAAKLIKKLCENYKIPYFSLTPTFSICKVHGYIPGNHSECPYDKDDVIEKPAK